MEVEFERVICTARVHRNRKGFLFIHLPYEGYGAIYAVSPGDMVGEGDEVEVVIRKPKVNKEKR